MISADFIEAIANEVRKGERPNGEFITLPGEKSDRVFWRDKDDNLTPYTRSRERVSYRFTQLLNFVTFIKDQKFKEPSVVFVNKAGVHLLWDRSRLDLDEAKLFLNRTKTFAEIEAIDSKKFTQPQFVSLLRVKLADSLESQPEILGSIRSLKFRSNAEESGDITHGKESFSKSLEHELVGSSSLPETVTINTALFEEFDVARPIRCALTVNLEEKVIQLQPIAGDIEKAYRDTLESIVTVMTVKDGPPVYLGSAT